MTNKQMRFAAMGLFSFLAACSPADGRPAGMSDDDISSAALEIVYPLPSCNDSFMGGTVEQCDATLATIADRRKNYENFEPAWMRQPIMHWFDHAERQAKENREDCKTRKHRLDMDAYDKRRSEERTRVQEILKTIQHR